MKKIFQKAISGLMIVLMVAFSAPIGQFADLDWSAIGSMFDFKAEAADEAYADSSYIYTIIGILEDYTVEVILNSIEPSRISEIVVSGNKFKVRGNAVSIDYAKEAQNKTVIFNFENNEVVKFSLLKTSPDILTKVKDIQAGSSGLSAHINYINGKFTSKSFNLEVDVRNLFRPQGTFAKEAIENCGISQLSDVSVAFETSNPELLFFKEGLSSDKKNKVVVDINSELKADEKKTINRKVYVNSDYNMSKETEEVIIKTTMTAKHDGKTITDSSEWKITIENKDYYANTVEWETAPYSKVLSVLSKRVKQCPDEILDSDEKADLELWFTEAFVYGSLNSLDNDVTVVEFCLDGVGSIQGLKMDMAYSVGEIYLQKYIYETRQEIKSLENSANQALIKLIDSKEFEKYIEWYESDVANRNGFCVKHTGKCPIDIIVKDDNGESVLEIIDEKIVLCNEDVTAFVIDGKKTFYLPSDINHSIEILATDDGTMEYDITEYALGGMERNIEFDAVPLKKGVSYDTVSKQKELLDAEEYNLVSSEGDIVGFDSDSFFSLQLLSDISKALYYKHPYVDIKEYEIPVADAADVIDTAKAYFENIYGYSCDGTFSYEVVYDSYKNTVVKFRFTYGTDLDSSAPTGSVEAQENVISEIKAYTNGMSDFDKAIYIHDYLVLNGEYDSELGEIIEKEGTLSEDLRKERYEKYALLVNGTGVCDTYASAYKELLTECGVECVTVSSSEMNHAWNMVRLDGSWYHVDCTWDDPVMDRVGISRYDYFLLNNTEITQNDHHSWSPVYTSTSNIYSLIPRDDTDEVAYGDGRWCYYVDGSLYCTDTYGKNAAMITDMDFDATDIYRDYIYGVSGKVLYRISILNPAQGCEVIGLLEEAPKTIYINKDGILEYYTYTGKSFERVDLNSLDALVGISVNGSSVVSKNGEGIQLSVTAQTSAYDIDIPADVISWSSSDEAVATVDNNGLVSPDMEGAVVITARFAGFEATYEITVEKWKESVSGQINGVYWSFDCNEEKLVISGTGEIPDLQNAEDAPWYKYRKHIKSVEIEDGITKIGENALADLAAIKELTIPESVVSVGEGALKGWSSLEKLSIPFVGSSRSAENDYDAVIGYIFGRTTDGIMQYYKTDGDMMTGTKYGIPANLKEIAVTDADLISFGAFYGCNALENVEICDRVSKIGDRILSGCSSIISLKVPFIGSTAQADSTYDAVVGYFFGGTGNGGTLQFMSYVFDADEGRLSYSGYYYDIPATFKKLEVTNDEIIPTGAFTNLKLDEIILSNKTGEISDYALHKVNSVGKLMIFNKDCVIKDRFGLINMSGTIYGYSNSEAETFALSRGIAFVPIDETICPHYFTQWSVKTAATCEETGVEARTCSECYFEETRKTPALGHNYSDVWQEDKAPACTENGSKSRHCSRCSATTDITVIPALNHNIQGVEWTTEKDATCVEDGLKVRYCARCSAPVEQEIIAKKGHSLNSWKVRYEATCEKTGLKYRACTKCDYEKTHVIAATGHSYSPDWIVDVAATCTEDGYMSRHCQNCDKQTDIIEIEATGHNFDGSKCVNCGYDRADECDCNCHKTGIGNFFFKFILIFQKIFGKNKECDCGAIHY